VPINQAACVMYTDTTLSPSNRKDIVYAVRNEKAGERVSNLSEELPVAKLTQADEVSYFYAVPSKGKIELYWDDVLNRQTKYSSYSLARKYGMPNSKSPLMVLTENLTGSSFVDEKAQSGNQYTYVLRLTDKSGTISEKSYTVTSP
jgi:hypothetical protein